jgi:hypothetical protein
MSTIGIVSQDVFASPLAVGSSISGSRAAFSAGAIRSMACGLKRKLGSCKAAALWLEHHCEPGCEALLQHLRWLRNHRARRLLERPEHKKERERNTKALGGGWQSSCVIAVQCT